MLSQDIYKFIEMIRPISLLPKVKLELISENLLKIKHLDGKLCEIGVFQGGLSKLITLICPEKELYCVDTFEGIKGADPNVDVLENGRFSCSLDRVMKNVNNSKAKYIKGLFPEIFPKDLTNFLFVHSDTDTYLGTKSTFDIFLDRMCLNGIIVFDDYLWPECPGVTKAIKEYISNQHKSFEYKEYPSTHQFLLKKID